MFTEIARSQNANVNPTEIATTSDLRGALGVGVMGEAAAKAVISRMVRNRRERMRRKDRSEGAGVKKINRRGKRGATTSLSESAGRHGMAGTGRGDRSAGVVGVRGVKAGGRTPEAFTDAADKGARMHGERGNKESVANEGGIFKAVLSSMAKDRLRVGLKEIKTNPRDLLRREFVALAPTRHGSTAVGCTLKKGWEEQQAGNQQRVCPSSFQQTTTYS